MKVEYTINVPICPFCKTKTARYNKGTMTTLMGWFKSYDKDGKEIGHDPNTVTDYWHCSDCNKDYCVITKDGNSTYGNKLDLDFI